MHFQHDASVLRQALFADVELRHDFDTGGDCILQLQRGLHDVLQDPIDTEANSILLLVGLDVNIAGATFHSVREDQVYEFYDRRLFGALLQVRGINLLSVGPQLELGLFTHGGNNVFKILLLRLR